MNEMQYVFISLNTLTLTYFCCTVSHNISNTQSDFFANSNSDIITDVWSNRRAYARAYIEPVSLVLLDDFFESYDFILHDSSSCFLILFTPSQDY